VVEWNSSHWSMLSPHSEEDTRSALFKSASDNFVASGSILRPHLPTGSCRSGRHLGLPPQVAGPASAGLSGCRKRICLLPEPNARGGLCHTLWYARPVPEEGALTLSCRRAAAAAALALALGLSSPIATAQDDPHAA